MPNLIFDSNTGYRLEEKITRDSVIWRYTDLPKFLALLETESLFLCRLDRFDDQLEGSSPMSLVNWRNDNPARGLRADDSELIRTRRRNTVVNCWHLSESESVAMWKLYSINNFGVAIRSTIERLGACLPKFSGEDVENEKFLENPRFLALQIGRVRYINFMDLSAPRPNPLELHFYKRASFQHEQEVRVVACAYPYRDERTEHSVFPKGGEGIPVDLSQLLEAVYLAPKAPSWYSELVVAALHRKNITIPIHRSDLDRDALF